MNSESTSIGIDIGGTRIKSVAVGSSGEVLEKTIESTVDNAVELVTTVNRLVEQFGLPDAIVGISAPGLASEDNRYISWMRGRLEVVEGLIWREHLGRDTWVLNDAHAATLAEAWIGAMPNATHAIMLTLGTGVGGGIIIDGKLVQGVMGRAGHLGHISLDMNGPLDIVRTPGSLEDMLGNHSLGTRTGGRFHQTEDLVRAAHSGDLQAASFWDKSIRALAVGITSLVNIFDPEIVVLGGGIAECGEHLFVPLRAALDEFEWRPTGKMVPVRPASLGEMAGAIGAARFAALQSQGETTK